MQPVYWRHFVIVKLYANSDSFSHKSHISDGCLLVVPSKSALLWNPLWWNVTNYCCSLSPYHSNPLSLPSLSLSPSLHPVYPLSPTAARGLRTDRGSPAWLWTALRGSYQEAGPCDQILHVCFFDETGLCVSVCVGVCACVCACVGDGLGWTLERASRILLFWLCVSVCVCVLAHARVPSVCVCLAAVVGMLQICLSLIKLLLCHKTMASSLLTSLSSIYPSSC